MCGVCRMMCKYMMSVLCVKMSKKMSVDVEMCYDFQMHN